MMTEIPQEVIEFLKLAEKSKLKWFLDETDAGPRVIVIKV